MAWRDLSIVDQKEEFVRLALLEGANISELCRRFGISRDKGYKWLRRYRAEGRSGLLDRSRRPHHSPGRTDAATEAEVLRIRAKSNNAWGGRKIARVLKEGRSDAPAASTITGILRRHGKLEERRAEHPGAFKRFERSQPNELWQMDFKGHFALASGRCHPLTVLDDHSRYSIGLKACANEQEPTVRLRLTALFRHYGIPFVMLMDNGPPWGSSDGPFTLFTVWLIRLGVRVTHGRPYHPQTQGKDERFHRTLKAEVLQGRGFCTLEECQSAFDCWRNVYNHERPHEALGMKAPASRYRPSPRSLPEKLPPIEYGPDDFVRKVDSDGYISFKAHELRIGKPFRGQPIALRETSDGIFAAYYCAQPIGTLDLHRQKFARGFVDNADALTTTPQAQQQQFWI